MVIPSSPLNGRWNCAYTAEAPGETLPDAGTFHIPLPVPGCWDDSSDAFAGEPCRRNEAYVTPDFSLPDTPLPDAELPFLCGTVWYRRRIVLPDTPTDKSFAVLRIGRLALDGRVFLNGQKIADFRGWSTEHEAVIPGAMFQSGNNDLVIAVCNLRRDQLGCSVRGFKGFSGGIFGDVTLSFYDHVAVADSFLHPSADRRILYWDVTLRGECPDNLELHCRLSDGTATVRQAVVKPSGQHDVRLSFDAVGLTAWSDTDPHLYRAEVEARCGDRIWDRRSQAFGFRRLTPDGCALRLNGHPVFLRGNTEHAYYAESCTPPWEYAYYERIVGKIKEIGFNWLRFHTSVPVEAYLDACDRLGMMVQIEAPRGSADEDWIRLLKACRRHPSAVIYCGGNEELLDEKKIGQLAVWREWQLRLAPDALFNPQEGLRGAEYCWEYADFGEKTVEEPFPHNPSRLSALEAISDVLGRYDQGDLSYFAAGCRTEVLRRRHAVYHRPSLSHEVTIQGTYLDLSLEERYRGTRIGNRLFEPIRRLLDDAGMRDKAELFYRNSCQWQRIIRKSVVECARRCGTIAGYDLLGGIDYQWHRFGYTCGIMNEFYELKCETPREVLTYNGPNVLLSDLTQNRTRCNGDTMEVEFFVSCFSPESLGASELTVRLLDRDSGSVLRTAVFPLPEIVPGEPGSVAKWTFSLPNFEGAHACRITASAGTAANEWDIWCFPRTPSEDPAGVRIVSSLDETVLEQLENGADVVLFGTGGLPSAPASFQISCAGRGNGNLATVVTDHPIFGDFPHEGWCDWQFYELLNDSEAVVFNTLPLPFAPLLELASSFKFILKQAALFELTAGRGRLVVCTLNFSADTPEVRYLRHQILRYAASGRNPGIPHVEIDCLRSLPGGRQRQEFSAATDEGFDIRGQL